MVPFFGWEMPVQYAGVVAEHMAVRKAAGLFDVSHMGEVEVRGPGAGDTLQRLTCNDVSVLDDGDAQYTALLNEAGGILDDLIVYRMGEERYLAVVNAANAVADFEWMRDHAAGRAEVVDRSDEFALLALQGPRAAEILGHLTAADLSGVGPFQFLEGEVAGTTAVMARTGYTGEDGFEILLGAGDAVAIWDAVMEQGRDAGLVPVGLGARDTLRLEAGMLLHGSDMTAENTPLEAGLGFIVSWDAGDFLGREVLEGQRAQGVRRRQRGLEMMDAGIARQGYPVRIDGEVKGEVTSGSFAPFLKKNIARAYLPAGQAAIGTEVEIEVRKRRLRARVVKTPFYRRPRR
jgi:aminomethyltransferase